LKHILDSMEKVCSIFTVLCLAVMVAVNMLQIFFRYVLNDAFVWVYPLTMLLFIWMTFLGAFIVYHQRKNIVVGFLVDRLPGLPRHGVQLASDFLIIFLLGLILAQAPVLIRQQSSTMQIISLPRYVQVIPLLIGVAGMFIDSVMDSISAITKIGGQLRKFRGES
jgi:TRAP-type C4-dicarboxylate transport system permease small subunit